jgi:hypothetical protein
LFALLFNSGDSTMSVIKTKTLWGNAMHGQEGRNAAIAQPDLFASVDALDTAVSRPRLRRAVQHLQSQAQLAIKMLMCRLHDCRVQQLRLVTDPELLRQVGAVQPGHESTYVLHDRLRAWQSLHPYYDDLVMLDAQGGLLARLDGSMPAPTAELRHEPWFQQVLQGGAQEFLGNTSLNPDKRPMLMHVHRLVGPSDVEGCEPRTVALLCFCFSLSLQSQRIFRSLSGPRDPMVLTLLDSQSQVIASSDMRHVPVGMSLDGLKQRELSGSGVLELELDGQAWLSARCGFWRQQDGPACGSGWTGQALLPLDQVFEAELRGDAPAAATRAPTVARPGSPLHRWSAALMAEVLPLPLFQRAVPQMA